MGDVRQFETVCKAYADEMKKPHSECNDSDVYRIVVSKKNDKLIGHSSNGKVIIVKNEKSLHPGFAKIASYEDKKSCFLADMENVDYDYYPEISEPELIRVLESLGFKEEYSEEIKSLHHMFAKNWFKVYANLDTGDIITYETWNTDDGEKTFNSVNVYIPDNSRLAYSSQFRQLENLGFSSGDANVCTFNIVSSKMTCPLRSVLAHSSGSRYWNEEIPSLWHYGERDTGNGGSNFADDAMKVYQFKDNLDELFGMRVSNLLKTYEKNGIVPTIEKEA